MSFGPLTLWLALPVIRVNLSLLIQNLMYLVPINIAKFGKMSKIPFNNHKIIKISKSPKRKHLIFGIIKSHFFFLIWRILPYVSYFLYFWRICLELFQKFLYLTLLFVFFQILFENAYLKKLGFNGNDYYTDILGVFG